MLPQRAVQLAIIMRVCSDLLAGEVIGSTGWTWAHALSALACGLAVWSLQTKPPTFQPVERAAFGFLTILCVVGVLRAEDISGALRGAAQMLSPLLILFAVRGAAMRPRVWVDTVLLASVLPLGVAMWHAAQGQHLDQLVHGYPRLRGGYLNYHNLGLTCALIAPIAAWRASTLRDRLLPALLCTMIGSAALYGLGMTWVRTGWVFLFVAVVVGLLTAREWRTALAIAAFTVLGLALNPVLAERFEDLLLLVSGQAPDRGWGAIGSSRFAIWREVLDNFYAAGPFAWFVGEGLGQHTAFHSKGLDPHLDYLALTLQLGAIGLLSYLTLLVVFARAILTRRSTDVAPLVLGVFAAALVVNGISNAFLARPTIAWILFGLIGTVSTATARTRECTTDPQPQEPNLRRDHVEHA